VWRPRLHTSRIGNLPRPGREQDVENLVAATIDRFGRVDLFVSNAGIAIDSGIDTPPTSGRRSSASTCSPRCTRPGTRCRSATFTYATDPHGHAVPLGAHMRRMNPRDTTMTQLVDVNVRRIIRRSTAFGAPYDPEATSEHHDRVPRGLIAGPADAHESSDEAVPVRPAAACRRCRSPDR
jgi:NAD(P)-dependent dehydrogenase (short-subunit alcohol dehydrogenase family)